jgi:hypothetical protein
MDIYIQLAGIDSVRIIRERCAVRGGHWFPRAREADLSM